MRSISSERRVPDDTTELRYLGDALDAQWALDTEYLGNRPDMERAWTLQNAVRASNGLPALDRQLLTAACAHFEEDPGVGRGTTG